MDVKRFRSPCELAVFLAIVLSALTITALFPFGASGETEDADFEVVNCVAKISPHQTLTIEVAGYLRYISPYLVASATVECSIPSGEDYTIGFIQQVDDLQLRMEYERATTSWEMPFFPINDASGALLPWYHAREGSAIVKGGAVDAIVEVAVNDNFDIQISWKELEPPSGIAREGEPDLLRVERYQKFTLWLVARRSSDGHIVVLRKIPWEIGIDIAVDPSRPLGERATSKNVRIVQPSVMKRAKRDSTMRIPKRVLKSPTANKAQEFWWTPKKSDYGKRTRLN